jgi:hypothetical protein
MPISAELRSELFLILSIIGAGVVVFGLIGFGYRVTEAVTAVGTRIADMKVSRWARSFLAYRSGHGKHAFA